MKKVTFKDLFIKNIKNMPFFKILYFYKKSLKVHKKAKKWKKRDFDDFGQKRPKMAKNGQKGGFWGFPGSPKKGLKMGLFKGV